MKLKIFVDIKSHKVVFAEARKDFVDFILNLIQLPLISIIQLLKDKNGMVGCFESLYKSIESLDSQYCRKNSVLHPKFPVNVPLLSLKESITEFSFYKCNKCEHASVCQSSQYCPFRCRRGRLSSELTRIILHNYEADKYMKEAGPYIVTDNLEVKPMSISSVKSLWDVGCLEEREVEFGNEEVITPYFLPSDIPALENDICEENVALGCKCFRMEEGLALLKASLEKEAVLTTVFLEQKV